MPDEKLIIAIDELSYWAEKDEALRFMENKVLSEKSPLFGRRDAQIKLEPFNYREAALFVPDYSEEDKAVCYGITGGVAKYLSIIDGNRSIDDNIKKLFFHTDGYLYDETRNLLTQEFSDIALANNIIEQIASGENTVNAIAAKVVVKYVLFSLSEYTDWFDTLENDRVLLLSLNDLYEEIKWNIENFSWK